MASSIIKVLLVDDDEDDYIITSDLISDIERTSYDVEWVSTYDDALDKINQHRHDVYLVDYRLGRHSGLDLIEQAIKDGCLAPLILLTGQGDSEVDIQAMEAGAMDYLVKGQLDASILERAIRYSIQRKRSEDIQAALFKISEATNMSDNLEELLKTIHKVLGTLIDTTNFYVALYDETNQNYTFPYIIDQDNDDRSSINQVNKSLTDYVRRTGQPILIDIEKHTRLIDNGKIESVGKVPLICLGVPLKTPQAIIGVVVVQSYTDPSLYSEADLDLLAFVSGHIAMAIERKKAEEEIRVLAKFPSENPNAVLRVSSEGMLLYANKASDSLLDYFTLKVGQCFSDPLKSHLIDIFTSGHNCEEEYKFGDNYYIFTFSPAAEQKYINIYIQDITERRRAEEQKKMLQEQLTRAERMESLGVLAGGVAHDLNNILGPLVAYPEIIKMKLPEDSQVHAEITKIEKSAERAAEVVQDLLTMARRGRYEMVPLCVGEVLNSYLQSTDFTNLEARFPDTIIQAHLDSSLPQIMGSHAHLYKVIMNLVMNACEAMPHGGSLNIKAEFRHIEKLTSGFANIGEDDYIILTVADTGSGIKKDDLKHLFEPFYSKKKMGTSGSGLGLAIVYGVIKDHSGFIDVRSEIGKGTEFIIYLPVAKEVEYRVEKKQDAIDIRGTEKVLVVDDLEDQRELAMSVLSSLGYIVEVAGSGAEGVEYLKHHDVDIVILDMIMEEDFDGLNTYEEIVKFKPGQKAIIASGFSETERVKKAERLGVGRYLRKPYTMQILGKAIREVLGETKAQPEAVRG